MAPNNLYIDEVYIDTNSGSAYGSITNILDGEDVHSSVSKSTGFKWIVQITNGSGSTIDMSINNLRLQICTNYLNDEGHAVSQIDTNIPITSGTITDGANYYIGWTGIAAGITPNTASTLYLADQKEGSDIVVASRIRLFLDGSGIDVAGVNSKNSSNHYYDNSIVYHIQNTTDGTSGADGSLRRKESVTSPATSYSASDWQISTINHLSAAAAGDPHITTFNGHHYEFDYLGAFRLFETLIDGNLIIINGMSEIGPGRWSNKQYIQKMFIQNNENTILFDMGFRGSPVKVLENNGFLYEEQSLEFNKEAKRYNFDNRTSTLDINEPVTDSLPALIRNQLILSIKTDNRELFKIKLQNVNEYNLQPCRISFDLHKSITESAKGCLVDIKYAPVSKLDNIRSIRRLEEPTLLDLQEIPELEIEPRLRNIKWR